MKPKLLYYIWGGQRFNGKRYGMYSRDGSLDKLEIMFDLGWLNIEIGHILNGYVSCLQVIELKAAPTRVWR